MILKNKYLLILLLVIGVSSTAQKSEDKCTSYHYEGRVELRDNNKVLLIGSASSVSFDFEGISCEISLQSVDSYEHHNYVALELDGKYIRRIRIEKGGVQNFPIAVTNKNKKHHLAIYKATEAANGTVLFAGTTAKIKKSSRKMHKKIEFIGNSITCGMGNDLEIPCGTGDWYDQHNAYWAYGPILSRTLKTDFLLSSVSGIGMYRNWNDEHINEAIMPDVYENLYLNKDNSKPYDFALQPDVVSICLGTNDLSEGDGHKARLPFNEDKYVANYINFIKTVYRHSPKTQIVLLNSPMVSGDRNLTLLRCLKKVIAAFETDKLHKDIALFEFKPMKPNGCGSHPDIADHKIMADQLTPFFKKILDEK
ncbi:SGNH/GDSL hydrolase family protein [Flavobacterium cellulosilyticum]|uniref:GDSL family lipase n=1 Tax=Flavobacterium cellulosilyticum TaxID=2541731 RepID=A0A4R5CGA5_9FLAO|nr:SGNH/GDSL hydrolase family protein [Flavobacterium cellulosilyticum]TDD98046.1 GDSL family lipase [Flavobacterium cellulosilyticum]